MELLNSYRLKRIIFFILLLLQLLFTAYSLPVTVTVSYMGEFLTHPGIVCSINLPVLTNEHNSLSLGARIGGYYHRRNNSAFFIQPTFCWNYIFRNGQSFGMYIGTGYLNSQPIGDNASTAYSFSADHKEIIETNIPSISSFSPVIGINYSGKTVTAALIPCKWSIGLNVFGQYPFNNYFLPHLAIELGIAFGPFNEGTTDE